MTDTVLLERRGAAAIVTLNRPDKLNALDGALMGDLDRVTRAVAEDGDVRAVLLRGAGRAFMAGGDVAHFHANLDTLAVRFREMGQGFHASVKRLRTMDKPVLACVHGAVAGGGLSVMLACDLAIASRDAQLSLAYANIGTSPDGGSSFTLPRIVGLRKALELAFLGERLDADAACALGLVNWVVEPAELEARAFAILDRLAAGPTFAFARTKALFNETWERPMDAQLDAELASFSLCIPTRDFAEGTGAFVAKRKPEFTGQVGAVATLAGKTLFITGASRGIGREIAIRAARDGANVAVAAKTSEPHPKLRGTVHTVAAEVEAAGGKALAIVLDVRDDAAIAAAVEAAAKAFGGIDILVNNASAIGLTPTLETPARRFDLMVGVNVRATFLCTQAAIAHLRKAPNPHVLNLAPPLSMQAKWFAGHAAYTISKYGMSLCTLGMAEEFRGDGIAVNSLWPATTIATAAVEFNFPPEILAASRHPAIMADAAHAILTSPSRATTGNFFLDEEVLRAAGIADFDRYAVTPGLPPFKDLFVD